MRETPFLQTVAEYYYRVYGSGIRYLRFVFPSRRSQSFFIRYLRQIAREVVFVPKCTTIGDFIAGLTPELKLLDRTALLFELYECYAEVMTEQGQEAEPFDNYLFWAGIILRDFDLIDTHLIPASQLYNNLEGLKELTEDLSYLDAETLAIIEDYWRSFENPLKQTDQEKYIYRERFLRFWRTLYPIYTMLGDRLRQHGLAYTGMQYRAVALDANDIAHRLASELEHETNTSGVEPKYIFVGLFEMSPSELKLLKAMRRRGIADFYWDEAVSIVQDHQHPAYRILQDNLSELGRATPEASVVDADPSSLLPQDIRVYQCASTITQVKALPDILTSVDLASSMDTEALATAIVLPNEQLLLPVVSSIPKEYESLNITLGYPLSRTAISILVNRWVRLCLSEQSGSYPVERILSLLGLQLLTGYYPGLQLLTQRLQQQRNYMLSASWILDTYIPKLISTEEDVPGSLYASQRHALEQSLPIARLLLGPKADGGSFLSTLIELLDLLTIEMHQELTEGHEALESDESQQSEDSKQLVFELEFVYHFRRLLVRLGGLLEEKGLALSVASTAKLIEGLAEGIAIPFEGDPLRGLQVMGVLESRLLHFPTLVYLSAQEGSLPRKRSLSTLIPYTLRGYYGLPSRRYLDAVEAYRFYQSVAGADRLIMIYGTDDPLGGRGEESRYISQMEMLYGAQIHRISVQLPLETPQSHLTAIDKHTPEIQTALERYLASEGEIRHLSPSTISTYLSCGRRFYYQEILGVRQEDQLQLLMPANDFGTLLHNTLETLYKELASTNGQISAHQLRELLSEGNTKLERTLIEQYRAFYILDNSSVARELSTLAQYYIGILKSYALAVIRHDAEHSPITYLADEVNMRLDLPLSDGRKVHLKGYIDRLDLVEEAGRLRLRVVDYKTGGDGLYTLHPENISEDLANSKYKATLQTLIYSEMLYHGGRYEEGVVTTIPEAARYPIAPGLYIIRQILRDGKGYMPYIPLGYSKADTIHILDYEQDIRADFLEAFTALMDELFDLDTPFYPTLDPKRECPNCPFATICHT